MRIAIASIVLLAAIAPALAQTEGTAFFRLGVNGVSLATTPPDTNQNGGDGDLVLSYPNLSLSYQDTDTVQPDTDGVAVDGYQPLALPPDAELNQQTGAITWHANSKGPQVAIVGAYKDGDFVVGYSHLDVAADIDITVSPPSLMLQHGTAGFTQTFTATASGVTGESSVNWQLYNPMHLRLENFGDSAAFDMDDAVGHGLFPENYVFQFIATLDGEKTYSPPIAMNIAPPPYFDYVNASTANYAVYNGGGYNEEDAVQIKSGLPISVAARANNGAVVVPSSGPAWLSTDIAASLPPGLSVSSTGAISGTTTAPAGSSFSVAVPAKTSGAVYGRRAVMIYVVNTFGDRDGDGILDADDEYPDDPLNGTGDADGDGIQDMDDGYPNDPWNGAGEPDDDDDGYANSQDPEPNNFMVPGYSFTMVAGYHDGAGFSGKYQYTGENGEIYIGSIMEEVGLERPFAVIYPSNLGQGFMVMNVGSVGSLPPEPWILHVEGYGDFRSEDQSYQESGIWDMGTVFPHFADGDEYHIWYELIR